MKVICVIAFAALMLGSARAGTQYEVTCSDKSCGFVATIGIGGGIKFEQSSGFCKKCDKVVSVTWKRDSRERPSHVSFWDALTGEIREIFHCPKCKSPIIKVEQIEDLKHCPKCGKKSLGSKRTILYD